MQANGPGRSCWKVAASVDDFGGAKLPYRETANLDRSSCLVLDPCTANHVAFPAWGAQHDLVLTSHQKQTCQMKWHKHKQKHKLPHAGIWKWPVSKGKSSKMTDLNDWNIGNSPHVGSGPLATRCFSLPPNFEGTGYITSIYECVLFEGYHLCKDNPHFGCHFTSDVLDWPS